MHTYTHTHTHTHTYNTKMPIVIHNYHSESGCKVSFETVKIQT